MCQARGYYTLSRSTLNFFSVTPAIKKRKKKSSIWFNIHQKKSQNWVTEYWVCQYSWSDSESWSRSSRLSLSLLQFHLFSCLYCHFFSFLVVVEDHMTTACTKSKTIVVMSLNGVMSVCTMRAQNTDHSPKLYLFRLKVKIQKPGIHWR